MCLSECPMWVDPVFSSILHKMAYLSTLSLSQSSTQVRSESCLGLMPTGKDECYQVDFQSHHYPPLSIVTPSGSFNFSHRFSCKGQMIPFVLGKLIVDVVFEMLPLRESDENWEWREMWRLRLLGFVRSHGRWVGPSPTLPLFLSSDLVTFLSISQSWWNIIVTVRS